MGTVGRHVGRPRDRPFSRWSYSWRSATSGSTRVARRAGRAQAATAIDPTSRTANAKARRIDGLDSEEQRPHCTGQPQSASKTEGGANRNRPHALADHQTDHLARLRPKCQPDTELARSLGDEVGEHAVNAERREQKGDACEGREHGRLEAVVGQRLTHDLPERRDLRQREIPIDGLNLLARRRNGGLRPERCADHEGERILHLL